MNTVILFSPSVNGFYDSRLLFEYQASNSLPDDATEMSESEVSVFYMSVPPAGQKLGSVNGRPTWVDLPPPTKEELIAIAEQKRQRLMIQVDSVTADWCTELALGEISDADKTKLSAWMAYKREVKTVDASKPIWPERPEV